MSMMKSGLASIGRETLPNARRVLWPIVNDAPASRSRLETIVERTAGLSARRRRVLGELIAASMPLPDASCAPLSAIWVDEAFERISRQAQLLSALDARSRAGLGEATPVHIEREVTARLAATLRLIGTGAAAPLQPCSDPLRAIVRDAVDLFGAAIGDVVIRTEIERVGLPSVHRRALVLAGYHLVVKALCEGFRQHRSGTISLALRRHGRFRVTLSVRDDGHARIADRGPVLGDLFAILDGAVACRRVPGGGTQVDLLFALPGCEDRR